MTGRRGQGQRTMDGRGGCVRQSVTDLLKDQGHDLLPRGRDLGVKAVGVLDVFRLLH